MQKRQSGPLGKRFSPGMKVIKVPWTFLPEPLAQSEQIWKKPMYLLEIHIFYTLSNDCRFKFPLCVKYSLQALQKGLC